MILRGGEASLLYLAWRHGNENPYILYHGLLPDYRDAEEPDAPPRYPPYPRRVRNFILACARVASEAGHDRDFPDPKRARQAPRS